MKVLNGLDGKSVLIGALAVGAIVAAQGGMVPLLLIGGLLYVVASKAGWWENGAGRAPNSARHRGPGGPPFFAEWHRQAHANDAARQTAGPPATGHAVAYPPTTPTQPPPPEAAVRIPVTPAPAAPAMPPADDRQSGGQNAAPLA